MNNHKTNTVFRHEITADELTIGDWLEIAKDLRKENGFIFIAQLCADGTLIQAQPKKTEIRLHGGIVITIPAEAPAQDTADAAKQVLDFIQAGIEAGKRLRK